MAPCFTDLFHDHLTLLQDPLIPLSILLVLGPKSQYVDYHCDNLTYQLSQLFPLSREGQ